MPYEAAIDYDTQPLLRIFRRVASCEDLNHSSTFTPSTALNERLSNELQRHVQPAVPFRIAYQSLVDQVHDCWLLDCATGTRRTAKLLTNIVITSCAAATFGTFAGMGGVLLPITTSHRASDATGDRKVDKRVCTTRQAEQSPRLTVAPSLIRARRTSDPKNAYFESLDRTGTVQERL